MSGAPKKIRVLVIDDSAFNRRALTEMLESAPDVAVVGKASDGEEGLKLALSLRPDAITLDLGMPHLDGFAFLRLVMAQAPTPVIVISSYAHRADVFKALELGAFDFIAKPTRHISAEVMQIRGELLAKVRSARQARRESLSPPPERARGAEAGGPLRVVVLGASTGGPPAVQRLAALLPADLPLGIAVALHMPEGFTKAFAERLDRVCAAQVAEARHGDALVPGRILVAPGGRHLMLEATDGGVRAALAPRASEKYCPSIDLLFESAATLLPQVPVMGVVLTGMGSDARRGARRLRDAGGRTVAEAEDSAVIFGMPKEAIAGGGIGEVLPLAQIATAMLRFGRGE